MTRSLLVLLVWCSACEPFDLNEASAFQATGGPVTKLECPFLIDDDPIVFSKATTGSPEVHSLHLFNPGNQLGKVTLTTTNSSVFQVPDRFVWGPFEATEVPLTFAPTDARFWSGTLTVNRGLGCDDQHVELSGRLLADVAVPRELRFAPIALGETRTLDLVVVSLLDVPQDLVLVPPTGLNGTVTAPRSVHLEPGQTVLVPISFTAVQDGPFRGALVLRGPRASELVQVHAMSGVPRLSLSTNTVSLESFLPGVTRTMVFVRNAGGGVPELTLESIQRTSGDATLNVEVVFSQLTFFITPQQPGASSWHVVLSTNDPLNPTLAVDVTTEATPSPDCGPLSVSTSVIERTFDGGVATAELRLANQQPQACRANLFFGSDLPGWTVTPSQPVITRDGGVVTLSMPSQGDNQLFVETANGAFFTVLVSVR